MAAMEPWRLQGQWAGPPLAVAVATGLRLYVAGQKVRYATLESSLRQPWATALVCTSPLNLLGAANQG